MHACVGNVGRLPPTFTAAAPPEACVLPSAVLAELCLLICEMCCLYLRAVPELHETVSVKDLVFCPTHRKGELVIFHISFLF